MPYGGMPAKITAWTWSRTSGIAEIPAPPTTGTPCLAISMPSISAFWPATAEPTPVSTPVGRPTPAAIEYRCRARVPAPVPISSW